MAASLASRLGPGTGRTRAPYTAICACLAGEAWAETSAPLLADLPMKQWVHLAAVFQRPRITTYVNGKKVGSATWDFPVGHSGDIQVGRWSGSTSHRGLIDEVRIYRRQFGELPSQTRWYANQNLFRGGFPRYRQLNFSE